MGSTVYDENGKFYNRLIVAFRTVAVVFTINVIVLEWAVILRERNSCFLNTKGIK